jgi:vacuolar iron transporter family protein
MMLAGFAGSIEFNSSHPRRRLGDRRLRVRPSKPRAPAMPRQPTENLAHEHHPRRIRARLRAGGEGGHLGDAVLGAIDGAITSFAVVAGAVGGGFGSLVVVVLGFASLFADGFSMAASNYLGTKSDAEAAHRAEREEQRHIDAVPEGQREELRQIFAAKGFSGRTLDGIVRTLTSDREAWARTIVQEELGLHPGSRWRALQAGAATFVAFLAAGLVPLLPFVVPLLTPMQAFQLSVAATCVAFIAIGAVKGRVLRQPLLRAALETLLIGGGAAALAYGVGAGLRAWLGQGAVA